MTSPDENRPTDGEAELRADLAAAASGDAPAVQRLLTRYLDRLRAFVRLRSDGMLRDYESSSDLVQSVCRQVLEQQDRFEYRGEPEFRAWLFTTALNKIRKRRRFLGAQQRDARRDVRLDEDAGIRGPYASLTPSRDAAAREQVARLERAFDQLPDDYREVLALSRIAGLPARAIGERMGRSEGAVRMLLGRALTALSRLLEEE